MKLDGVRNRVVTFREERQYAIIRCLIVLYPFRGHGITATASHNTLKAVYGDTASESSPHVVNSKARAYIIAFLWCRL